MMAITFEEVCSRLKQLDEITLMEVLEISSEEVVNRFRDLIEYRIDELAQEFEDEDSEGSGEESDY